MAPLNAVKEVNKKLEWTVQCEEAFVLIKEILASKRVLILPDFEKEFVLDTDASDYGISGVLSQDSEGRDRPVGYFSRALSKAQKN